MMAGGRVVLMAVRRSSLAEALDERAMSTQTALGSDPKTRTGTDPRNGPSAGNPLVGTSKPAVRFRRGHGLTR